MIMVILFKYTLKFSPFLFEDCCCLCSALFENKVTGIRVNNKGFFCVVESEDGVLTEQMVLARSRASDLFSVKKLNCWLVLIAQLFVLSHSVN